LLLRSTRLNCLRSSHGAMDSFMSMKIISCGSFAFIFVSVCIFILKGVMHATYISTYMHIALFLLFPFYFKFLSSRKLTIVRNNSKKPNGKDNLITFSIAFPASTLLEDNYKQQVHPHLLPHQSQFFLSLSSSKEKKGRRTISLSLEP